jgi:non-ribosomal peptide synthetase-like protein
MPVALTFEHFLGDPGTAGDPRPKLIHEFFERQVDLRPGHPAIECKDQVLTYAQLEQLSNQIAHFLRNRGIGPETLVGLYFTKSCRLFAAMLGILKAGAGYVPIDPHCPIERIRQIVDDARLVLLMTDDFLLPRLNQDLEVAIASTDQYAAEIALLPTSRLPSSDMSMIAADICYVIYTSGSTGRPKGVVLEHRNVVNFISALKSHYNINEDGRVYQGFSVAFDASVEEIWAALSVGGTLVVPPEDIAKSPSDAADFINSQKITYFSTVPTFLSLIAVDLPSVRQLVVGGEACSAQLVSRWADGKRCMLNTYGPTETAVVATLTKCNAGETVTIGQPLPGYSCHILDEQMKEVGIGNIGELYIGGRSVARGYMGLPELTAKQFVQNPFAFGDSSFGRLYRTHDLVRLTETGDIEFIGRSDDQVKIRGFRIELPEIEAVLMEHPSIRTAAVVVHERLNMKEIAAYVVVAGPFGPIQRKGVADLLSSRLPEYMYPKYLEVVDAMPTMTSGKVDRKRLPNPENAFIVGDRAYIPPANELEADIVKVWEEQLNIKSISMDDDFFRDLKANSMSAAHVVTELRNRLGTLHVSVRDLYNHRTVRGLTRHMIQAGATFADRDSSPDLSKEAQASPMQAMHVGLVMRWACAFLQAISLIVYYAVVSAPLVYFTLMAERVYRGHMDISTALGISTIVGFAMWPSWLFLGIAIKWLVIGRYKPGRYPVWGFYYFRWWLASRFRTLGWPEMFSGTPLMSLYYRAMGAKVGKNCSIGTSLSTAFDLISIGEDTSIGVDAQLLGYRVENGWLVLGTVDIGSECFIGMHCAIGLNVVMGDRARLDDASLLADGVVISSDAQRGGSPPINTEVELPVPTATVAKRRRSFLFGLIHLGLIYVMGYFLILSMLPAVLVVWYSLSRWGLGVAALSVFLAAPTTTLWYATLAILARRLFIGRVKPGVFPLASLQYLRYWFLHYLMNNTRQLLLPMYATVFLPSFLRLMGAKIGKGVEISTVQHVIPDLLEIEDGSFLADACIVGGHRIYRGLIDIQPNKIGRRTFIGNSALIPGGRDIGNDSLIGVMSKPPVDFLPPDGTRWLGSPSFEVPSAENVSCFGETSTYSPKWSAKFMRTILDILRIFLPGAIAATDILTFCAIVLALDYVAPLWIVLLAAPLAAFYLSLLTIVWVARIKMILVGTFEPTVKPLWCSFVWLNEVVNGVYETSAATALAPLMGTPYISIFLRKLGCRIGRWVFLETTLFSEFDLVEIGDCAALNMGCTIQTHLFEDRVMKADHLKIGAGCSVGNMAVVLYSSEMKDGSSLAPLSVLMKGETLPPHTRWHGIPSEPEIARPTVPVQERPRVAASWDGRRRQSRVAARDDKGSGLAIPFSKARRRARDRLSS